MSYYSDYEEDYWGNDYEEDEFSEDIGNSAGVYISEGVSMSAQVGERFTTGNATVRNLKAGTVIEVVAPGTLEIVELPEVVFNPGDRVYTKHGASTVVRLSSRFGNLQGFDPDTQVLYVSDDSDVVRRAAKSDVSAI